MSSYKRDFDGRIISSRQGQPIPEAQGEFIGPTINLTGCRTARGRVRPINKSRIIQKLLSEKTFTYQSLVGPDAASTAFFQSGFFPCNSLVTPGLGTFPHTIQHPVYVFRLGVPTGRQSTFPATATNNIAYPVISYRLTATRASANVPYLFYWKQVAPNQNVAPSAFNASQVLPIQGPSTEDTIQSFNATELYHKWSSIDVLYSNPVSRPTALVTGVVSFTRDVYCPPDSYYDEGFGIQAYRANSGWQDAALPSNNVAPAFADQIDASQFWQDWLANRNGHPLRLQSSNPRPKPVLRWHQSWCKSFGAQLVTNTNQVGVQHRHSHLHREYAWHDTHVPDNNEMSAQTANGQRETNQITIRNCGVFPLPHKQKWFFLAAFNRSGVLTDPNIAATPTFDIRIRQKFASYDEPVNPQ